MDEHQMMLLRAVLGSIIAIACLAFAARRVPGAVRHHQEIGATNAEPSAVSRGRDHLRNAVR